MRQSPAPAHGHQMPSPPAFPATHTPGPVTAASVLLYVYSGLSVLGAVLMAAAAAIGRTAADVPVAGMYTNRVVLIGFGGAVLLVLLAAADIALGVFLSRGRRWAQLATVGLSAVVAVVSLATPLAPLCVLAALVLVVLVVVPGPARRHFRHGGS